MFHSSSQSNRQSDPRAAGVATSLGRAAALAAVLSAVAAPSAMAALPGAPSSEAPSASGDAKAQRQSVATQAKDVVPGRFIVKLKGGKDAAVVAGAHGASLKSRFTSAMNGFTAEMTGAEVARMKRSPSVEAVEPVMKVEGSATQTASLPWGLDRIDQRYRPHSGSFTWGYSGAGVNAYIIDSGIQTNHPQFGGRATAVFDNVGDGWNGQDCHGHGTHVAGTVGSATFGVAKSVRLYGVRTLNCQNSGDTSKLIAAVDWVRRYARRPAVVNISIGAPRSALVNQAVTNLANSGIFVSVSAGNDNVDACTSSPASAVGTFTVAASDYYDNKASFSNWGGCVDGYAPGVNVLSAYPGNRQTTMNGTSMAAPHVAGIIAVAKSAYGDGYTSASWVNWLISNATANVIGGNFAGTPSRMVFKGTL
jgi:subtilisin family serine protease